MQKETTAELNAMGRAFFLSEKKTDNSLHLKVARDWKARCVRWGVTLIMPAGFLYLEFTLPVFLMSTMLVFVVALYEQFEMKVVRTPDKTVIERHPIFSDVSIRSVLSARIRWHLVNRILLETIDDENVAVWIPPTFAYLPDLTSPGRRVVDWLNETSPAEVRHNASHDRKISGNP